MIRITTIFDFQKTFQMSLLAKITVRGPYTEFEKGRIASLIDNHPFNTEVCCFVPFINSKKEEKKEERKIRYFDVVDVICNGFSFEMDDEDEDDFLSLSASKSIVYDDSLLLSTSGYYYKIKGFVSELFKVVCLNSMFIYRNPFTPNMYVVRTALL